jgi:hypothetical protein
MPLKNHPTDPEKYIYKSQEYNLNQISEPSTISFYKEINQSWVMRITADRRIEVAEGADVTEAARLVLDAMQGMLDVGLERAVLAEREACAKACEHQPHWTACCAAIRARGSI